MLPSDSCVMIPLGSNRPKLPFYKHFASYNVVIQFNCYKMMSCEILVKCMYSNNPVTHRARRLTGKSAYMSSSASSFRWVKIKRECHLSNVQQSCEKRRESRGSSVSFSKFACPLSCLERFFRPFKNFEFTCPGPRTRILVQQPRLMWLLRCACSDAAEQRIEQLYHRDCPAAASYTCFKPPLSLALSVT